MFGACRINKTEGKTQTEKGVVVGCITNVMFATRARALPYNVRIDRRRARSPAVLPPASPTTTTLPSPNTIVYFHSVSFSYLFSPADVIFPDAGARNSSTIGGNDDDDRIYFCRVQFTLFSLFFFSTTQSIFVSLYFIFDMQQIPSPPYEI